MKRLISISSLFLLATSIWYAGIADLFSLAILKQKSSELASFTQQYYAGSRSIYILVYTCSIFLGLPLVMPLSLLGGYLFGLWQGIVYALLSITAGSVAYFLLVRAAFLKKESETYTKHLTAFRKAMHTYGYWYLLFLHITTILPSLIINTLAALAPVSLYTFIITTVLGSLPCLFMYSFAGQQLETINTDQAVLQPIFFLILLLLALLALTPILAKKIHSYLLNKH